MLCWLEDKNIKPDVFQFIGADPMGVQGLDPNRNLVVGSVLWLGPHKNFTEINLILEYGPMPNMMVALPNIGGALWSTPQSLADAHYLTAVQ